MIMDKNNNNSYTVRAGFIGSESGLVVLKLRIIMNLRSSHNSG